MSSAYTKQKLKQSREAIAKADWSTAADAARDILEHEPNNYNANVFRGLALLNLEQYPESEKAYTAATADQPRNPLAWQGLEQFYSKRNDYAHLRDVLRTLIDIHHDADNATKCAECFQRLLALEREDGGKRAVRDTLEWLLPNSKYYPTFASLDPPDQTKPESTTTFETQMAVHVNSLPTLQEIIQITEQLDSTQVQSESEKRRLRLDGARKGKQAILNEVRLQVFTASQLPSLYEQLLSHPQAPDDLRRETEGKLLRRHLQLLHAYPAPQTALQQSATGTAAVDPNQAAEQSAKQHQLETQKEQLRSQIVSMAEGMVIIGVDDELAWEITLEWTDHESLVQLPADRLRTFVSLFPRSGRTKAFTALLLLLNDQQFIKERNEYKEKHDIELLTDAHHADLLTLAIDGLEGSEQSLLCHRIAATLYLLDRDFASATDVANAALSLARRIQADASISLSDTKSGIEALLLTALTHLHPPQHHSRALRLAQSVLATDPDHLDAILAKAYIDQAASRWQEARQSFERARALADATDFDSSSELHNRRLLSISPDPALEAAIEIAWCDVHLDHLSEARATFESILDRVDPITFQGVTAEERARIWWRLGRCLWQMGGELREDPSHAFTCFVTAIKRNPAFAPAYTSLGIYYETIASPPDAVRASKCFQKAFELDARENEAARRLAEGFADEREWDLVEVVARRTIQGEGGADALEAGAGSRAIVASRRHLSQNAWAWKAVGSVEMSRKAYEKAINAFQIALRAFPDDRVSWQRLGEAYAAAGRHVAALKCFAKCVTDDDKDAWQARYSIADVQRQLGNYDLAIEILTRILETHADQVGVRVALADTLLMAARREFALGYVERAYESVRRTLEATRCALLDHDKHLRSAWKIAADACFLLATKLGVIHNPRTLLDAGLEALLDLAGPGQLETDDKLPSISAVTAKTLKPGLSLLASAEADADAERVEGPSARDVMLQVAVFLYKLRVVLNASDDKVAGSAWADLAVSLFRLGGAAGERQALGCIKEALRHEPGNESYWLVLGHLTFNTSVRVASHSYIRAIEAGTRGSSAVAWTSLGLLYLHHGDVDLANEALIQAQTADPDWAPAWVGQALVATRHGDTRAAAALFAHAYLISEGSVLEACYGHAYTAAPSASTAAAMSAYLSREPRDADALHLAALTTHRLGQHALASHYLSRATRILEARYERTEDPDTARKYALAMLTLARVTHSPEAAETALALLDPPGPLALATAARLNRDTDALLQALAQFPADPEITATLAALAFVAGDADILDAAREEVTVPRLRDALNGTLPPKKRNDEGVLTTPWLQSVWG